MGLSQFAGSVHLLLLIPVSTLFHMGFGARKLNSLYQPPAMAITYHNGDLLEGDVHVSILWYGKFTAPQKAIVADFFLSLNQKTEELDVGPSVFRWWSTVQIYMKRAGKKGTRIVLANQVSDENYSVGKMLKKSQIFELTRKVDLERDGLTLVLTAEDVAVDGFCMSNCGFHGSDRKLKTTFIWVGNSVSQCPGQCAWPFHRPIYWPQTPPLLAPNGDVGVDGMIVNIAILLAGTVTNPFGNGYFMGSVEAATACPGVYGKGAYPGYAGDLLRDPVTGGSYNAVGIGGRKYLLPALFDPSTSQCSTLV